MQRLLLAVTGSDDASVTGQLVGHVSVTSEALVEHRSRLVTDVCAARTPS